MAATSMLSTIRLELARCPEYATGSPQHGYATTLPVTADGCLDAAEWHRVARLCRFRRFCGDQAEEVGDVQRHRHGWSLVFQGEEPARDDREPILRAEAHRFRPGDSISIRERNGALRTFRVAAATAVA